MVSAALLTAPISLPNTVCSFMASVHCTCRVSPTAFSCTCVVVIVISVTKVTNHTHLKISNNGVQLRQATWQFSKNLPTITTAYMSQGSCDVSTNLADVKWIIWSDIVCCSVVAHSLACCRDNCSCKANCSVVVLICRSFSSISSNWCLSYDR